MTILRTPTFFVQFYSSKQTYFSHNITQFMIFYTRDDWNSIDSTKLQIAITRNAKEVWYLQKQ